MKVKIALFLTLVFLNLVIAPTVVSLVDNTIDISFSLNLNEEEENSENGAVKELSVKFNLSDKFHDLLLGGLQKNKNISFWSKNYISEYPSNTTPPPKFLL